MKISPKRHDSLAKQVAAQWAKGPTVFRDVLLDPIFSDSDFISAIQHASNEHILSAATPPWRVFVGGAPATPEQLQRVAIGADTPSFEDYEARLEIEFPDQDVSIILDNCERGIPRLRQGLIPLLHELFAIVGYPARLNHACLYAGRYRATASGIHKDPCHVLMFCGIGKKAMAFWPNDYFPIEETDNDHLSNRQVEPYLKDATIIEIMPHDILYWPADYWHISLGDVDHFNAAISMGIYHRGSSAEHLLSEDFLKVSSPKSWVKDYPDLDIRGINVKTKGRLSVDHLRKTEFVAFFEHWNRVLNIMNMPGELEFRALKAVLELTTSAGFGKLAQPLNQNHRELHGSILSCPVPQSLATAAAKDGVLVGANGSVSFHACDVDVLDVALEQLRAGKKTHFETLLWGSSSSDQRAAMESVLREAIEAGAIYVSDAAL